jgi:hypothetical protein
MTEVSALMKFAHFSHIWAKPGMTPHQRYEELWRELQLCDELGFDYGFCVAALNQSRANAHSPALRRFLLLDRG